MVCALSCLYVQNQSSPRKTNIYNKAVLKRDKSEILFFSLPLLLEKLGWVSNLSRHAMLQTKCPIFSFQQPGHTQSLLNQHLNTSITPLNKWARSPSLPLLVACVGGGSSGKTTLLCTSNYCFPWMLNVKDYHCTYPANLIRELMSHAIWKPIISSFPCFFLLLLSLHFFTWSICKDLWSKTYAIYCNSNFYFNLMFKLYK